MEDKPVHYFDISRNSIVNEKYASLPTFTITITGGNQAVFDQLVQELTQRVIGWDNSNNQLKKL